MQVWRYGGASGIERTIEVQPRWAGAGEELMELDDGYVLPKRLNVKQVGPGRELRDATLVRRTERVRHELCLPAVPLEGWEHKRSIQSQRECKPRAERLALLTEVDVALRGMHKGE